MTGRRLYDKYTDATARNFSINCGTWQSASTPLPAWPSLSNASRRRWNDLARSIAPKVRKRVPSPT